MPGTVSGITALYSASRRVATKQKRPILRALKILALIVLAALLIPYVLTPFYRTGHPVSTLMIWRRLTGAPVSRQWIDLHAMSPSLPRAVVGAEDAHFCKHHGIDFGALREAINDAQEGEGVRGASTITQQVAKNLFLWQGTSFIRKALEFPLATLDRPGAAEAADPGDLSQHRRARSVRAVRRRNRLRLRLRAFGRNVVAAGGGAAGVDPAQPASAQCPPAGDWGEATRRNLHGAGAGGNDLLA